MEEETNETPIEETPETEEDLNETTDETETEEDTGEIEEIEPEIRGIAKSEEETDSDEDEIPPEDEKVIRRVVAKQLRESGLPYTRDQIEVDNIIRDNPEYSKYRSPALKYMQVHPTLVAKDAFAIVTSKDQQRIGAIKERQAAQKAKETKSPGAPAREASAGAKDYWAMSDEEFLQEKNKLFYGGK